MSSAPHTASLPSAELLEEQARWLAPARARLLRQAAIAHRHAVLDLGAGRGAVTGELQRRGSGHVYALDLSERALHELQGGRSVFRIVGRADNLPFPDQHLDLVFSQFAFLWTGRLRRTLSEIRRVLEPGGCLCAIEPDYLAMIEHPPEIALRDIWLAALERSGAVSDVGRRLPALLQEQGFEVRVRLLDHLQPPSPVRFDFLRELPLNEQELDLMNRAETAAAQFEGWRQISHLPLFLISAVRR